jgi:hypothetical protein
VSPARRLRAGLLVLGGVAGLAAAPGVRRRLAARIPWAWRAGGDPVAPFAEAPCQRGEPAAERDGVAGRTEALP